MSDNDFSTQLNQYEQNLSTLEGEKKAELNARISDQDIVNLLLLRDAIEQQIELKKNIQQGISKTLIRLTALDKRLSALGKNIAKHIDLEILRKTLNHPEHYWWWYFQPPIPVQERFDWVWNALTAGALALAASFMYNIYSAFATGNANIATALSTIIQVAGLAIVGKGALTQSGKAKIQQFLTQFDIRPRFYAVFTFGLSLIVLSFALLTNHTLDQSFTDYANSKYAEGELNIAEIAYQQAKELDPHNISVHDDLAKVYESRGELKQAGKQYMIGSSLGNVDSLMGLGRVLINNRNLSKLQPDYSLSESYLLMALQRAYNDSEFSAYEHYQLNRNMGWVLIQQKKYQKAIQYLEKAMKWRLQVKQYSQEGGTGNCFLAYAYEQTGNAQPATQNWKKCIQHGKPDYIHEYRWLVEIGKHNIAFCVDTSEIVGGFPEKRPDDMNKQCQLLLEESNFE